ncbi:hypothetical protein CDD81_8027 [Ophiocordyceps australis]|uniref:Mmc1 C-terminal domain-containing protein n=1 Tax=Ophiocordyceps australis TaxID=1399860 RepID=A0A2C5XWU8_9HYPO|nr:hypothetical protein CDD81_8027 [Ophiocordyceps australis]
MAYRQTLPCGRLGWRGPLRGLWYRATRQRQWQTTAARPTTEARPTTAARQRARGELEQALRELEQRHANLVNLPWLQLAQQSLEQLAGEEVVRVAIWGLGGGRTAKRLVQTLLADGLSEEQAWERELAAHDEELPLIVRVEASHEGRVNVRLDTTRALHELHVSSPQLNGLKVQMLLVQAAAPPAFASRRGFEEAVLVPLVGTGSAAHDALPLATPVHQTLLVASGLPGAVSLSALPVTASHQGVRAAVDLPGVTAKQLACALDVVDVARAQESLQTMRRGPQHALDSERLWLESNVPALVAWLKTSATPPAAHSTKPAVRRHLAALLDNVSCAIDQYQDEAAAPQPAKLDGHTHASLARWAQRAHAELQDELDLGFAGRRWRKLAWWKLFWRVDDVAMLTSDMLSQRFLPTAEQELVYLAGCIATLAPEPPCYPQPGVATRDEDALALPPHDAPSDSPDATLDSQQTSSSTPPKALQPHSWFRSSLPSPSPPPALPKWPGHIAFTRRYLDQESVPALQSLAQSLVAQALATAGATSSLAALLYLSSASATLYEVGAVAALGLIYSLARMQRKWDAARSYWEGEVREEGRKAIRGAEASVAAVLRRPDAADHALRPPMRELTSARELVQKAKEALARIE